LKAARLVQYDAPLSLTEVAHPKITAPNDVIVKIAGAGVCHTDLHLIEGVWKETLGAELPITLGHENAGFVAEIGPGVTEVKVGDPVVLHPMISCGKCLACRAGRDNHCANVRFPGLTIDGGFADYIKTSERAIIPLPAGSDPVDIAPYADAGITAYRAVKKLIPLAIPGTTAVIVGVGGLGHIGVQLMRELGNASITVIDRSVERLEMAMGMGAENAVRADERAVDQVRQLTKGLGADLIVDFVGTDQTHRDCMQMLRKGGTYSVVGYGGLLQVPSLGIINNEFNIVGNLVGTYNELYELMELHRRGKVKLHAQRFALSEINTVLDRLHHGKINGRAVVIPD